MANRTFNALQFFEFRQNSRFKVLSAEYSPHWELLTTVIREGNKYMPREKSKFNFSRGLHNFANNQIIDIFKLTEPSNTDI